MRNLRKHDLNLFSAPKYSSFHALEFPILLCAEWPILDNHRPSHLELGLKPISVERSPCLPQVYIWLLLCAVLLSHHFDSYCFWYACKLTIHWHPMPVSSSPSWSHGSSRAGITLFPGVGLTLLCVEILSKYCSKTSPLRNSPWWLLLNPFLGALLSLNVRMLTIMQVWVKS